jgi:hypothetical protein
LLPDAPTRLFPRALQKDWGSEVPQALSSSFAILGNWAMQGPSDFASALLQSITILAIRTTRTRERNRSPSRVPQQHSLLNPKYTICLKKKKTFDNQPEKKIKNKNWVSELGENQSPEIFGGFFDGHKTRIQSSPDIKAPNKHTK